MPTTLVEISHDIHDGFPGEADIAQLPLDRLVDLPTTVVDCMSV